MFRMFKYVSAVLCVSGDLPLWPLWPLWQD